MSDEKKPFAEALRSGDGWMRVVINGEHSMPGVGLDGPIQALVAAINSAVEQREANLRGAIQALIAAYDVRRLPRGAVDYESDAGGGVFANPASERGAAWSAALAALGPTPPAYVPASELHAEREKTRGMWGVLFDGLYESGGEILPAHHAMIQALGLKVKPMTDMELIDEFQRRFDNTTPVVARDYAAFNHRVVTKGGGQMDRKAFSTPGSVHFMRNDSGLTLCGMKLGYQTPDATGVYHVWTPAAATGMNCDQCAAALAAGAVPRGP